MPNCDSISDATQFKFDTDYQHTTKRTLPEGTFYFRKTVPSYFGDDRSYEPWHKRANDHTTKNGDGCMYLVNVADNDKKIFSLQVHNLCVGKSYWFSAYLANFVKAYYSVPAPVPVPVPIPIPIPIPIPNPVPVPVSILISAPEPSVRFEVRNISTERQLLAECETGHITATNELKWREFGVQFKASYSSVELLIISNTGGAGSTKNLFGTSSFEDKSIIEIIIDFTLPKTPTSEDLIKFSKQSGFGNKLAIDDIQLRTSPDDHPIICPTSK